MQIRYIFRRRKIMSTLDWIVVVVYLAAMLGVGFFAQGKVKTMDDFILGGKR